MMKFLDKGKELGLSKDELAFYDALAMNEASVRQLGDAALKEIAQELTPPGKLKGCTLLDAAFN